MDSIKKMLIVNFRDIFWIMFGFCVGEGEQGGTKLTFLSSKFNQDLKTDLGQKGGIPPDIVLFLELPQNL